MGWRGIRNRLVSDRFTCQLRARDDTQDEGLDFIWWIRVRWMPPLVPGKKDTRTLGGRTAFRLSRMSSSSHSSSFAQLQQLLLESRNEVMNQKKKAEAAAAEAARPAPMIGLALPIMGRGTI